MKPKNTSKLQAELAQSGSLSAFLLNNERSFNNDSGQEYIKRIKPFWDKRLAGCCAHNWFADGEPIPHLQPEQNFRPGTRPGRK